MVEPSKVFVGNLSYDASDEDLCDFFGQCGKIEDAVIILDKETQRPRGFGFVTFSTSEAADTAIKTLHEKDFLGRPVTVREAQGKRGGGGGGGYGGGGGGYGGGGYGGGGGGRRGGGGYGGGGYGGGGGGYGGGRSGGYGNDGGYRGGGGREGNRW